MTAHQRPSAPRTARQFAVLVLVTALFVTAAAPVALSSERAQASPEPTQADMISHSAQASTPISIGAAAQGATQEWQIAALDHIQLDMNADWTDTGQTAGDFFGSSVAGAGDVNGDGYADAVIAAYAFTAGAFRGKVYAYYGSAQGLSADPDWTATGENDGDRFGAPVAGAGDVNGDGYTDVVIGARDFPGPGTDRGKAYVFTGSSSGLSSSPAWTATGENDGDYFGTSAAGAGDVNGDGYADVIVGAGGFDSGRGKVYVFHGSTSGPSASADWTATGGTTDERFGVSVAGAGDVNGDGFSDVIVGANQWKVGIGKAYVFTGRAGGLGASSVWDAVGESTGDYFGSVVAGAGDVNGDGHSDVIVGADGYDDGAQANAGRAYVYEGGASGPDSSASWMATGENGDDRLGRTVAGIGDVNGDGYADVIVGAPFTTAGSRRGRTFVHLGSDSGPSTDYDVRGMGVSDNDLYGSAIGGAGDVNGDGYADLIVAAPGHDAGTAQGKAYVYHGSAVAVRGTIGWFTTGETGADQLGYAIAGIGDVNADGYSDVAMGAPGYGGNDNGRVYIFLGSRAGFSSFADWTVTGEGIANRLGSAVTAAGDVNGDGYGDLLIGAEGHPAGSSQGKAYVYYGSELGLSTSPDWSVQGESMLSYFGESAAGGDVNGDGYSDVVIGAHGYPDANVRGKVYGYYGSADGLSATPDWSVTGEYNGDRFGESVSGAGDVNGDGCADVIVGARGYDNGVLNEAGRAYVFTGSALGLGTTPYWTSTGMSVGEGLGESVTGAGDVNGDGYADVLVGVPNDDSLQGRVYAFHGGSSGVSGSPDWTATGEYPNDYFGGAVATAGDVNGDGYADVLVGSPFHASGGLEGAVSLYYGSAQGLNVDDAWGKTGENAGDELGQTLASAGDMDGDGYADILIGAHGYLSHMGRVYVYSGNAGPGRLVVAQQAQVDATRSPVPPWGALSTSDRFYVHLRATDPLGRGRVKLEAEACPAGAAFGDATCTRYVSPSWKDVTSTAAGIRLGASISGLKAETLYRWRARVLYAPYNVVEEEITPPPNPAHGPWRRVQGQAFEGDLRTAEASTIFLPLVVRGFAP